MGGVGDQGAAQFGFALDGGRHVDERGGNLPEFAGPWALTATEWKLLTTLASVPGRVFSRYELVNRVRGYEYEGYERTIGSHIRNLRRKIETDAHAPSSSTP